MRTSSFLSFLVFLNSRPPQLCCPSCTLLAQAAHFTLPAPAQKVPQRRRSVQPAPAHADSIGSENSKSSFAACTGASGDADSGLRHPTKRAALTSAASILVSFSGNA